MIIFKIILYLNNSLLFLSVILGIIKLKLLNNKEKWYVYYAIFLLLIELINKLNVYKLISPADISFLYPVYIAGEFFILTSLYIKKIGLSNYWLIPFSVFAIGFLMVSRYFNLPIDNDYAKAVSNISIVCFAGYALLQEIKGSKAINRFLLVDSCVFFYYSVSVFAFVIQHQLATISVQNASLIWGINNFISSILYGALIYTFIKLRK